MKMKHGNCCKNEHATTNVTIIKIVANTHNKANCKKMKMKQAFGKEITMKDVPHQILQKRKMKHNICCKNEHDTTNVARNKNDTK